VNVYEFKLPDLGEGVHEGEVLHWHVKPGDQVSEDDPLVEVETDKAAVTIPSPKAGKIVSLNGDVGQTVSVGSVLVVIEDGAASSEMPADTASQAPASAEATSGDTGGESAQPEQQPETPSEPAPGPSQLELVHQPAATSKPPSPAPAVVEAAVPPTKPTPPVLQASPHEEARGPGADNAAAGPIAAAPATRRRAREMGIDLREVPGTGPGGRVTTDDLLRYAKSPGPAQADEAPSRTAGSATAAAASSTGTPESGRPVEAPDVAAGGSAIPFFEVERLPDFAELGPVEREPLRSIRRKVAHKMVASMTIAPHVAHMDEADVTELEAFRREQNSRRDDGVKLTLLSFIIKAAVAQLRRAPKLNASIDPHRQEIVYKRYYNIGFAADTPKGLVVPVIEGADRLSISEIGRVVATLAEKARSGALDVSELRGGTFTVTNVGSLGGTNVIPTINYPEVAILGLGRAADKPVVRDGRIVVRKILPVTLSFDHRLVDGADAARFVSALVGMLSDPGRLLVDC
jgi:pyruvate dehydrogenase E2 component (dihydrolipoamide acetyltransferase)